MEIVLSAKDVSKKYSDNHLRRGSTALKDVSIHVHKGEFLVLLGPSGCGKSTFLRLLAGLDSPTHGTISRASHITKEQTNFVFQNFALLPWLSVVENVELGLVGRGVSVTVQKNSVSSMLRRLNIEKFSTYRPHQLSGGQQQRVGLARAFVTNPQILFLDEPFSELDFYTAEYLRTELLSHWEKVGMTVVMVSHYIDEAVSLADRIAVFSERPGTIVEVVHNSLGRPRQPRTSEFFAVEDRLRSLFHSTT